MLKKIAGIVNDVFSEYIDVSELEFDTPFDSLDIDSLVLVELAVVFNQRLNFLVAEFEIKQANGIRRLTELYEAKRHFSLG
jgi:acyl carrier protein